MIKSFFGDRQFYKKVMSLALPIMVQNGITNLVNMLDNIMVGRLDIASSTGVTVVNQLIFVFNLCLFGAISGAGIFGAQFYGKGDSQGLKYAFRFKIIAALIIGGAGIGIFAAFGQPLINLYLQGDGGQVDAALALSEARDYLALMLIGLIPFAVSQSYAGTLRECDRPMLPMVSGTIAVFVNLIFNYILIYGHLGFEKMGVRGAAIATVLSRFVEMFIIVIATHKTADKTPFIKGVFKSFYIPSKLVYAITLKTLPLMANETVWSTGMAAVNRCYSLRGIEVVAACNILQTFFNVFSVAYLAVGMSIGILLGQRLGETTERKPVLDYCKKLITFSCLVAAALGALFFVFAYIIPNAYNYPQNVKSTATALMQVCAVMLPTEAFSHACYFTLRSGGKTLITFLFDSGYVWVVNVVAAFLLVSFTDFNIVLIYFIIQFLNALRCVLGFIFVRRGSWIRNITV